MPKGVVDETPPFRDDYQLALVEGDYFADKLRPKQFLHIDQSECILCEGCVDICPWKCIHYLSLGAIDEAVNVDHPADDETNFGFFVVEQWIDFPKAERQGPFILIGSLEMHDAADIEIGQADGFAKCFGDFTNRGDFRGG